MICECVVINVGEEEVRGHAGHTLLAATMAPSLPRSAPAPLLLLLLLRVLLLFSPAVRTHGTVMPRQFCCCTDRFIRTLGGGFFWCGESGTRTGWTWSEARRGEARGGRRGATLALHRSGKRSSKDTERRDRGRIQVVQSARSVFPPLCCDSSLF